MPLTPETEKNLSDAVTAILTDVTERDQASAALAQCFMEPLLTLVASCYTQNKPQSVDSILANAALTFNKVVRGIALANMSGRFAEIVKEVRDGKA